MRGTPPHLKTREEPKKTGVPALVEVLREEGLDVVRYVLWDSTGWDKDYSPPASHPRAQLAGYLEREPPEHGMSPCTPLA